MQLFLVTVRRALMIWAFSGVRGGEELSVPDLVGQTFLSVSSCRRAFEPALFRKRLSLAPTPESKAHAHGEVTFRDQTRPVNLTANWKLESFTISLVFSKSWRLLRRFEIPFFRKRSQLFENGSFIFAREGAGLALYGARAIYRE